MTKFSKRHGHNSIDKEITIREDAPPELRQFVVQLIYDFGYKPTFLRSIICKTLRIMPDRSNWSDYPNIAGEVDDLIDRCEWYYVYDIIEAFWDAVDSKYREEFSEELNDFFKFKGIGWKIEFGLIETRGDIQFEKSIHKVVEVLKFASLQTAQSEMHEAIKDLSRRPQPDITGAIQHSLACLECVCREVSGDKKITLGEIIKKHPTIVPKPLDSAIEKIWGFSSEQGRHLKEGNPPAYIEAELLVELTAALSSYLGKKLKGIDDSSSFNPF